MKVQLSQYPDVLGKIQIQSRNQQYKIYKKKAESNSRKEIMSFFVGLCYLPASFVQICYNLLKMVDFSLHKITVFCYRFIDFKIILIAQEKHKNLNQYKN
jgi:hypothetical protein